ncbi:hypothetical protein CF104_15325 [Aeromonas jandaei]|nr:hypothetical protein [Aeromonas jandaei]TNH99170.1 hypothetical protein CF104_15325 [Aeromonas jandaei]
MKRLLVNRQQYLRLSPWLLEAISKQKARVSIRFCRMIKRFINLQVPTGSQNKGAGWQQDPNL